jgi:hypothetical protein
MLTAKAASLAIAEYVQEVLQRFPGEDDESRMGREDALFQWYEARPTTFNVVEAGIRSQFVLQLRTGEFLARLYQRGIFVPTSTHFRRFRGRQYCEALKAALGAGYPYCWDDITAMRANRVGYEEFCEVMATAYTEMKLVPVKEHFQAVRTLYERGSGFYGPLMDMMTSAWDRPDFDFAFEHKDWFPCLWLGSWSMSQAIMQNRISPSFEDVLASSWVDQGYTALIEAGLCAPTYDQLDQFADAVRALHMDYTRIDADDQVDITYDIALQHGLVPDYDRHLRLLAINNTTILGGKSTSWLETLYQAGLRPDKRHEDDARKAILLWLEAIRRAHPSSIIEIDDFENEIRSLKQTYWRRFCIARRCWRKWEHCLIRPGGLSALAAERRFGI